MSDVVRYEVADRVATITLDRPEARNALSREVIRLLPELVLRADGDPDVDVVILTGADPVFCAGLDLKELGDTTELPDISPKWPAMTKPVIGAINGAAVGIGVTMQLPMDIRIASTDAKFGFVFARRGIVPEACSSYFLPRLVGPSTALEWCFSGRVFPASEAKERGLVRSVHAPEDLLPAAHAIAREIVDNTAPVSVSLTRQMLWRMLGADHPMEAHKIDSRAIFARGKQADAREGVTSFLEKRTPTYPDKVSRDMPDFYPWFKERKFE